MFYSKQILINFRILSFLKVFYFIVIEGFSKGVHGEVDIH